MRDQVVSKACMARADEMARGNETGQRLESSRKSTVRIQCQFCSGSMPLVAAMMKTAAEAAVGPQVFTAVDASLDGELDVKKELHNGT